MRIIKRQRMLVGPLAIGCLLIVALGWYLKPTRIWASLGQIEPTALGIAALLIGPLMAVQWVKWQRLLLLCRPQTRWSEGLESLLLGMGLGLVSPGRVGELGRGLYYPGQRGVVAGLAGVDRFCSFVITLGAGIVGLGWLNPSLTLILLGGGFALMGLGWSGRRFWQRYWMQWRNHPFWRGARAVPRLRWVETLAWSALFNGLFFSQFYLILAGWGPVPAKAIWGIPMIFALKALVPFSFLDLGVREAAAVLVGRQLGLDEAEAFNAAMVLFAFNVLLPGLVGWGLIYRRLAGRLSQLEHQADDD